MDHDKYDLKNPIPKPRLTIPQISPIAMAVKTIVSIINPTSPSPELIARPQSSNQLQSKLVIIHSPNNNIAHK